MTGLHHISHLLAAAQSHPPVSVGLNAPQFLLLVVAGGFLLYVLAGHRQPRRVVAGLLCIAIAAAACGAFLFLPARDRIEKSASLSIEDNQGRKVILARAGGASVELSSDATAQAATEPAQTTDEVATEVEPAAPPNESTEPKDLQPAGDVQTKDEVQPTDDEQPNDTADAETATDPAESRRPAAPIVRPEWVDAPPLEISTAGAYQEVVTSGQFATWKECQTALDAKIALAVGEYLERIDYAPPGARYGPPLVSRAFIDERIVKELYSERPNSPRAGEMCEMHALLAFDDATRRELRQSLAERYESGIQAHRLLGVGALAGLLLALVGSVYGYLRIDTATKGYYSGYLQIALFLIAITIISGASVVLSEVRWDADLPAGLREGYSTRA